MVIIASGIARPNTVSPADSRRVSESLAPSTSAAGRWTSRPSRAISDRCPRGGLGWTAATGDTRPAHQAGMTVAIATVSTVPTPISAIHAPERGARPTGVPVRRPDELRRGHDPRGDQPEGGPGRPEQGLLGEQHPDHLPGREPEGLQHRDVLPLHQHAARGDVGDGARGGHQGDDPEQGEQQPEQPVVARHRVLHLLPGGVALDGRVLGRSRCRGSRWSARPGRWRPRSCRTGAGRRSHGSRSHRLDLGQQPVLHPDQAGRPLRVETLVGGVRDADHPHLDGGPVDAVHGDLVADPDVHRLGERRLEDHAVRGRGPQPGSGHHAAARTSRAEQASWPRSSTGDLTAPCWSVADAAW